MDTMSASPVRSRVSSEPGESFFASLPGVFSRAAGMMSPTSGGGGESVRRAGSYDDGRGREVQLSSGSSDHLRVAGDPSLAMRSDEIGTLRQQQLQVIREFIHGQGDRIVHFSGDCYEILASLPVRRMVIVTESALYRVPQSTIETGIFFDCRTPLDHFSQIIAVDVPCLQDGTMMEAACGAQLQLFERGKRNPNETVLSFTLSFGPEGHSRRKSFLLSVCLVCPTLSILQKRRVEPVAKATPQKETPAFMRPTTSAEAKRAAAARRLTASQQDTSSRSIMTSPLPAAGPPLDSPQPATLEAVSPAPDVTDSEFAQAQALLRQYLEDNAASAYSTVDPAENARRPPEEDMTNVMEREKIKAMILSRESKIAQNIEFKLKYPQKVPTRVPPGVEYDKAHEEQRVLPDDFADDELLGPSLFPLWDAWKMSGGLLTPEGMPSTEWTLYDSNDLIDSLKSREETLFGIVGRKSMRRLLQMRELVQREKQMFINKSNAVLRQKSGGGSASRRREGRGDDDDDDLTPGRRDASSEAPGSAGRSHHSASRPVTKVTPFKLSQSPSQSKKPKLIDSALLVSEMKANFEKHLKTLHQLRKEQLERELQRVHE